MNFPDVAGVSGMVGAYILGKRKVVETNPEGANAHNVLLTFIGASLLWVFKVLFSPHMHLIHLYEFLAHLYGSSPPLYPLHTCTHMHTHALF